MVKSQADVEWVEQHEPGVYITFTSLPVSEEPKEDTPVKEEAGTTDTVVEEAKEETTIVLRCSSYTVCTFFYYLPKCNYFYSFEVLFS